MVARATVALVLVGGILVTGDPVAVADIERASPWLSSVLEYDESPNGEHVVYTGAKPAGTVRLYSMSSDGERRPLSSKNKDVQVHSLTDIAPRQGWLVTPDSQRVIYRARNADGIIQLYSVPIGGGETVRINEHLDDTESFWGVFNFWLSPSSDYVVWTEERENVYSLWSARTDGSERRRLHDEAVRFLAASPSLGGEFKLAISPDGTKVAMGLWERGNPHVWIDVANLDGSAPTTLLDDTPGVWRMRFTGTSDALTYTTTNDGLVYHPLDGSAPTTISTAGEVGIFYSRGGDWAWWWQRDDNDDSAAFGARLDGSSASVQLSDWGIGAGGFNWDDSHFFYNLDGSMYRTVPAPGAEFELVHETGSVGSFLSPDGSTFMIWIDGDPYAVSTKPGGPIVKLVNVKKGETARAWGFNQSGSRFLISINDHVSSYTTTGDRERLDPRGDFLRIYSAKFLSDKRIVYQAQRSDGMYAVFVADEYFCDGYLATHVGTPEDDVLTGTAMRDVMVGRGGDDVLKGGRSRDHLCGNDGNDTLSGAKGNDRLFGRSGADTLLGKAGNDFLSGGPGTDSLDGGTGTDTCKSGETVVNCE